MLLLISPIGMKHYKPVGFALEGVKYTDSKNVSVVIHPASSCVMHQIFAIINNVLG